MKTLELIRKSVLAREPREKEARCVRLFHGDTEGDPRISIESFAEQAPTGERSRREIIWIFEKEREGSAVFSESEKDRIADALGSASRSEFCSVYWLLRPKRGLPAEEPSLLFGEGIETLVTEELGIKYRIRTQKARHPGVFLDHFPLRKWLIESRAVTGTVLNTFSYTGSLSCAAFRGGAESVLTLDLSKPTIEWARENWELNGFTPSAGDFIYGDVFEWLPKFRKKGRSFDAIILDPPSFSRGKAGVFSTDRDLDDLHTAALDLLSPGGLLISSINSETVSPEDFRKGIEKLLRTRKSDYAHVRALAADPLSFPRAKHLKGSVFRVG